MPDRESRLIQDPSSGYASADALDPEAPLNRDRGVEDSAGSRRDAMSGYASADVLSGQKREKETHQAPIQDPASGYVSADALEVPPPEK